MKKATINFIANCAIGTALFVVLSVCLQVPVFQNYYLCLGYVAMTVFCYSVGTFSGTLVGTVGVILYCLIINGLRGMPGWAMGNLFLGVIMGTTFKSTRKIKKTMAETIVEVIVIIVSTAVAMLGIKSTVECLLYSQPFLVRVTTNMYAFIADAAVITLSLPICRILEPHIKKL